MATVPDSEWFNQNLVVAGASLLGALVGGFFLFRQLIALNRKNRFDLLLYVNQRMSERFGPPHNESAPPRATSVVDRYFSLGNVVEVQERSELRDRFYALLDRFRETSRMLPAGVLGSHAKKNHIRSLVARVAVVRELPEPDRQRDFSIIRHFVNVLNDVAEMVEAGLVDVNIFLGKYHLLLIREVFIAEGYIYWYNLYADSGRWGMRALRVGEMAREYNDMSPIQRQPVKFTTDRGFGVIYAAPGGCLLRPSKLVWLLRRTLHLYPTLTARSKRQQQRFLKRLCSETANSGANYPG